MPDGRRAVSASDDQTLKVWDLESGRELRTLTGHSGLSRRGGECGRAAGGLRVRGQTLKVWDLESGRELRTLEGHSWCVCGVAMTCGRAAGGLGV